MFTPTQPSRTVAAALTQGVTGRIAVTSDPSQTSNLHPKPLPHQDLWCKLWCLFFCFSL